MSQPGWYPDPGGPASQRWWDGHAWTGAVQPVQRVQPAQSGPPFGMMPPGYGLPNPSQDFDEESRAGRRATVALVGGAVAYTVEYIVSAALLPPFYRSFRDWLNMPVAADGTKPPLHLTHAVAAESASSLVELALVAVGIVFLMWFYKAVTVAQRLGLPSRWSSGWAIGGWFIPIVSFWFPYQSAVDSLPAGHPGRSTVKRWWALWIATQLFGLVLIVIAFTGNSSATWVAAVIGILVAAAAAHAGMAVIREINRVHAGLLGR